jgi:hypothetical protein
VIREKVRTLVHRGQPEYCHSVPFQVIRGRGRLSWRYQERVSQEQFYQRAFVGLASLRFRRCVKRTNPGKVWFRRPLLAAFAVLRAEAYYAGPSLPAAARATRAPQFAGTTVSSGRRKDRQCSREVIRLWLRSGMSRCSFLALGSDDQGAGGP